MRRARRIIWALVFSVALMIAIDGAVALALIRAGLAVQDPGYGLTTELVWKIIEGLPK